MHTDELLQTASEYDEIKQTMLCGLKALSWKSTATARVLSPSSTSGCLFFQLQLASVFAVKNCSSWKKFNLVYRITERGSLQQGRLQV